MKREGWVYLPWFALPRTNMKLFARHQTMERAVLTSNKTKKMD
jgi:hypothetical protein